MIGMRSMHVTSFLLVLILFICTCAWDISLRSPCKINLFLRVMGRRPNGYHDLASLFQSISLSDYMHFSKLPNTAERDEMACSDTTLAVDGSNLVVKALDLMRKKTGVSQYFKVLLDKKVPMQAGLGGGSSNAATAMHAFNALCDFPASLADLELWSGDIGSDITFFFSSGSAYCTGRGEIVQSIPPLPDADNTIVHVFKPKEGLSTALVFKNLDLDRCLSGVDPTSVLQSYRSIGPLAAARDGLLLNDLQPPAFALQPKLAALCQSAKGIGGASGAMMSGSGTSVYLLSNKSDAIVTRERVKEMLESMSEPPLHFECSFVNRGLGLSDWYS